MSMKNKKVGIVVKNPPANAGDMGLIPGSGRSPGEESGNLFQYFCLRNPRDRGAWWAIVHGVTRVKTNLVTKPPPQEESYPIKIVINIS